MFLLETTDQRNFAHEVAGRMNPLQHHFRLVHPAQKFVFPANVFRGRRPVHQLPTLKFIWSFSRINPTKILNLHFNSSCTQHIVNFAQLRVG